MTRGVTLLELLLALVVIGLAAAITLPRFAAVADRLAVEQAAGAIVAAHRRARVAAVLRSQVVELSIDSAALVIRPYGSPGELWREPGPAADRVTLTAPEHIVLFSPVGLSMGAANGTYHLSRGSAARTVIVSRLGRVRTVVP